MPGIRTSMITTFGRRRSASATALSPSAASPITRMWGERDSYSRRPSRTTSWSSTMRQVISAGVGSGVDKAGCRFYARLPTIWWKLPGKPSGPSEDGPLEPRSNAPGRILFRSHRKAQLLRIGGRRKPEAPAVADAVAPHELAHAIAPRLRLLGREIGPVRVQALVFRQELGPVALDAGATGVWANLLYLKPGTKEHFLAAVERDWPELLPEYERLYAHRAYFPAEETQPVRDRVRELVRSNGIRDRRRLRLAPPPDPEQLSLAV